MMNPFSTRLAIALVFTLELFSAAAADTPPLMNPPLMNKGYDVVSYFEVGSPQEGLESLSYEWDGRLWQFANAHHRDLFIADPEKYAPAYEGYCAYAASKGLLAVTDPQTWTIADGRLFLNFSPLIRVNWLADRDAHIVAADENWPALKRHIRR